MMCDMSLPLVTIIIPCYNHSQFITHSIQSLISQTYENIELIIIDDGSQDNSIEKIRELVDLCEKRFIRFEFITQANKGLSKTLNEGISWANGKYWTICSSDDYYHENKISKQVEFLEKNKQIKYCITKAYVVDDVDNILDTETEFYNLGLSNKITFEDIFTFKVNLPVTGIYDRDFLIEKLKGFDSLLSAEDYDINLRIVQNSSIGFISENLYYYRSPQALGRSRVRLPVRIDVSESHFQTIQKYKNHLLYNKAMNEWKFRKFLFFSAFKETKFYALTGFFGSLRYLNRIQFYRSLIKCFFVWK